MVSAWRSPRPGAHALAPWLDLMLSGARNDWVHLTRPNSANVSQSQGYGEQKQLKRNQFYLGKWPHRLNLLESILEDGVRWLGEKTGLEGDRVSFLRASTLLLPSKISQRVTAPFLLNLPHFLRQKPCKRSLVNKVRDNRHTLYPHSDCKSLTC